MKNMRLYRVALNLATLFVIILVSLMGTSTAFADGPTELPPPTEEDLRNPNNDDMAWANQCDGDGCSITFYTAPDPDFVVWMGDENGNVGNWEFWLPANASHTIEFPDGWGTQITGWFSSTGWYGTDVDLITAINLCGITTPPEEPVEETPVTPTEKWVKPAMPLAPICEAIRYREVPGWNENAEKDPEVLLALSWTSPTEFNPVWTKGKGWVTGLSKVMYGKASVPFSLVWDSVAHPATAVTVQGATVYDFYTTPPTDDFVILAGLHEGPVDWKKVKQFRDVYGMRSVAKFYPCSDSIWVGDLSLSPIASVSSAAPTYRLTSRPGTNSWEVEQFLFENFQPAVSIGGTGVMAMTDNSESYAELAEMAIQNGYVDLTGLQFVPQK